MSTWPHLLLIEFVALLAITALLIVMSVVIQAPLLEAANANVTPNPSKAPWYFLGLQELLTYFDPQIAGVTVPTIIGLIGFMAIPVHRSQSIEQAGGSQVRDLHVHVLHHGCRHADHHRDTVPWEGFQLHLSVDRRHLLR